MSATAVPATRRAWTRRAWSWLRNPWAQARFLWVAGIAYVLWSLVPVLIAVAFSFNAGRSLTTWQGSSTRWYCCGINSLWADPELRDALFQSLKLASMVTLVAVPLGVAFALGLHRWRGSVATGANFTMLLSFITPEIAIAVALLLTFTQLARAIGLGFGAQASGLSMYLMPYALIVVRARLLTMEPSLEEAANDLGASTWGAIRRVTLPLLVPAIVASAAIVFAVALDNWRSRSCCPRAPARRRSRSRSTPLPAADRCRR
ncbi:MAG: ABC transporter permease subunit [Actinomycetota bacterium]